MNRYLEKIAEIQKRAYDPFHFVQEEVDLNQKMPGVGRVQYGHGAPMTYEAPSSHPELAKKTLSVVNQPGPSHKTLPMPNMSRGQEKVKKIIEKETKTSAPMSRGQEKVKKIIEKETKTSAPMNKYLKYGLLAAGGVAGVGGLAAAYDEAIHGAPSERWRNEA